MKKLLITAVIFFTAVTLFSFSNYKSINANGFSNDSLEAAKQMYVDQINGYIAGKENMASDSVFKDIEMLKGVPAEHLLKIMQNGFSTALGVGCDHCHNTSDFASNEKNAKQIARKMMEMSGQIRDLLSNIKEIQSDKPTINCTTCHRGEIVPALKIRN
ncbi:MAG: c-type cytochrome [Bacteroidetes bacterium]|nr:c-type cytochrome [Bacteroidota bacterium]